jgi:hypothetical protein
MDGRTDGRTDRQTDKYRDHAVARTDDNECVAVDGMRAGKGNGSAPRKPAPVPVCPSQIPHALAWDGIRAAMVGISIQDWAAEPI